MVVIVVVVVVEFIRMELLIKKIMVHILLLLFSQCLARAGEKC